MRLLLLTALLALPGAAIAGPTFETEYRYPASRLATAWRRDTVEVRISGALAEDVPGRPDLPVVAERVELPPGMRIRSVSAVDVRLEPLAARARVRVVPPLPAGVDALGRPRASAVPTAPQAPPKIPAVVEVGNQGSMRGRSVAWVLVRPVRWNPQSQALERVASVRTRIELEPVVGPETVTRERIVAEWEEDVSGATSSLTAGIPKRSAEPFAPTQLPSVLGSPVAYVIVTSDALALQFQRLADWKTQSGVPAVVRTLTTIRQEYSGVDDADRVRRFLRDAYARWGTKWALIGGDTHVIPARVAWTTFFTSGGDAYNDIPTDLYYSCLDGNWNADGDSLYGEGDLSPTDLRDNCDLLPEIWVGRAPVGTLEEATKFVDKVFQYSRTPVGDYENRILFFAEVMDPQDWSPGEFIWLDGAELTEECLPSVKTKPAIRYARLYENYLDPGYEPGALPETRRAVLDSLHRGYNLAVHSGHGFRNVMSVGDSNIANADAFALANGNRLTNFYTVNCTSNAIDFPCIGEALMKATGGGAVSNIGSTRLDFPHTGRSYQKEFFRLVYEQGVTAVGEAQGRQKLIAIPNSVTDNTHRWTQMTLLLLGDPEMRIWTGEPRALVVTKPASLEADDTTLAVHVTTGGAPLAGARVTAYKAGDDYASGITNASGDVVLDFRPDGAGSVTLTVTAANCVPHQSAVPLVAAPGPLLVEGTIAIDDDASGGTSGNGDGLLDAGEVVDLTIPLRNGGSVAASSVTATLIASNSTATVVTPAASYGTIASGATVSGATKFRISTPYTARDQLELGFTLSVVDGAGRHFVEPLRFTLRAPELRSFSNALTETIGDGDGVAEVGETISQVVTLRNSGSGGASGVTAILRRLDVFSTVADSTAAFGAIGAGASQAGDVYSFVVGNTSALFELRISTAQGLIATQRIDLLRPTAPASLGARGFASSIQLTWTPNPQPDLMGYNVYRAATLAGPYSKINTVPADRVAYYLDSGLAPLTVYHYRVSAVDSSGNESGTSASVAVSTTPPSHTVFPMAMKGNSASAVTVARIYQPGTMDVIAGGDFLHVWHADGTSPVDADGSSITPGDFSSLGSYYAAGAAVGDVDGGGLEIVAPTWNDQKVFVFDPQGQVKAGWPFSASSPLWSTPALGDLDGNGTKEIVFASNGNLVYALRGNGAEWIDGDANPATSGVFKVLGNNYNYGTPAIVDLDANGQKDILFSSSDGLLHGWRPNGTNLPGFPIWLQGPSTSSVAVGYLDGPGDAQLDVVATSGEGDDSLYVFLANGGRRPGFPVRLVTSGGFGKQPSPALADMNGDGRLDIVAAGTDGKLYVYDRNGALLPAFANVRFSALTSAATEASPVVADINGDGSPDIVIGDDNATLSAFNASGQLLPGFPIVLAAEVKGTPALCDCDGDGLSEIAAAAWDGQLYMWDYDFPFSPGAAPPWPQFHHDAMRTGYASVETLLNTPPGEAPKRLQLAPPSPNPTRGPLELHAAIPSHLRDAELTLEIFDAAGRRVAMVARRKAEPGPFSARWDLRADDGGAVSAGVYMALLRVGSERMSRRLVVLP